MISNLPVEGKRVEVFYTEKTGPYRKLLPTLEKITGSDIVITADDDIFYCEYWLEKLINCYAHSNGDAVAARVRVQRKNRFGRFTSYMLWDIAYKNQLISDNI